MAHTCQFPLKMLHPRNPQIEKLGFLGISRLKSKWRFWINSNLHRGMFEFVDFVGFRGVALSVESVIELVEAPLYLSDSTYMYTPSHAH